MRERPILFSASMVRAILAGQKTQTRRIVKPEPHAGVRSSPFVPSGIEDGHGREMRCPYGQPDDRLWVRESFRFAASLDPLAPSACADKCLEAGYRTPWAPIQYEADGQRGGQWHDFDTPPVVTEPGKLRASIHMPRWASRITLEITRVRAQRLQDISEADAQTEGTDALNFDNCGAKERALFDMPLMENGTPYRNGFALLWESINGDGSWAADPWVWVVEFRRANHA